MLDRHQRLEGCLLGCAVGDAIGLPYEGLSPRRIAKMIQRPLRHRFLFGRGMVSDDTDHSIFVAQALARHPDNPEDFARCFAWRLRCWFLCLPAGIGLATLRSILKLWAGVPPVRSGVFSAGNGAAMRSAIIGVFHHEDSEARKKFVTASTRITHSDPKADYGAQAVAELAALVSTHETKPSVEELRAVLARCGEGDEWTEVVERAIHACTSGKIEDALVPRAGRKGVSGYIYHTLPVAVAAWHIHYGDFWGTIESVVMLGGDTDTAAAIAGALAGITAGGEEIPQDWIGNLTDCPHSPGYIARLSTSLAEGSTAGTGFSWLLFPRGLLFTATVLCHGLRRLLPPY